MNAQRLGMLVLAVVAGLLLLWWLSTEPDAPADDGRFLPALSEQVNELRGLTIEAPDAAAVELVRSDDGWQVVSQQNYPADWATIQPLLADLARAGIAERKTDDPDLYHHLGLATPQAARPAGSNPGDPESRGTRIRFQGEGDLPAIILGNAAGSRDGRYARREDQAVSVLLDRNIPLPQDPLAWLEREIIDLRQADIRSLTLLHDDGDTVHITRPDREQSDFRLEDVPEGLEPRSGYIINGLAGAFSGLRFEEVRPAQGETNPDLGIEVETFDGLRVTARITQDEDASWLRLEARAMDAADRTDADRDTVVSSDDNDNEEDDASASGQEEELAPDETARERAAAINQRVSGWSYRIPSFKFDAFNKRMADLTQEPVAEADPPAEEGNSG